MLNTATRTASLQVFANDLARFDKVFRDADALVEGFDGAEPFTYIDESKVSAETMRAYRRLIQYGAANGLI